MEHLGKLVTKDELLQAVWPEVAVSEAVLTGCLGELHQALGDDPRGPRVIETVHRGLDQLKLNRAAADRLRHALEAGGSGQLTCRVAIRGEIPPLRETA